MNVITLSLSTAVVLAIAAVGCAADPEEGTTESSVVTPNESLTPQISAAEGTTTGGNGVICNADKCVCQLGSSDPVDSCNGMKQICSAMGGAVDCGPNPQAGTWCSCTWVLAEQGGSGTTSTGVSPIRGIIVTSPATLEK